MGRAERARCDWRGNAAGRPRMHAHSIVAKRRRQSHLAQCAVSSSPSLLVLPLRRQWDGLPFPFKRGRRRTTQVVAAQGRSRAPCAPPGGQTTAQREQARRSGGAPHGAPQQVERAGCGLCSVSRAVRVWMLKGCGACATVVSLPRWFRFSPRVITCRIPDTEPLPRSDTERGSRPHDGRSPDARAHVHGAARRNRANYRRCAAGFLRCLDACACVRMVFFNEHTSSRRSSHAFSLRCHEFRGRLDA